MEKRSYKTQRKTNETEIEINLDLDGQGIYSINTPCLFFNHMLEQLSAHSKINLELKAHALDCNNHHLIEDCAIVLGIALKQALLDKKGIKRYSSIILPMDDALVLCALDISNRPYFKLSADFKDTKTQDFETVLFYHFFNTLCTNAGFCLHIKILDGFDTHHMIEASYKAFAKCLLDAIIISGNNIPSTKGQL